MGVFEVHSDGTVWKIRRKQQARGGAGWVWVAMTPKRVGHKTPYGHLHYAITVNRVAHSFWLHRVVWRVLCGDIPEGLEINHKNGDASDNRPENMELVTHTENMRHRDEVIKTTERGEQRYNAKLTEAKVRMIRASDGSRSTILRFAEAFGVNHTTVEDVLAWRTWKHVS